MSRERISKVTFEQLKASIISEITDEILKNASDNARIQFYYAFAEGNISFAVSQGIKKVVVVAD